MPRLVKILVALFLLSPNAQADCPSLKIGILTGLTGEGAVWGKSVQNGFDLGVEESGCPAIKVFYEDDQFVPSKAITAFWKLVRSEKVDVVIVTSSGEGNTVAPLAEKAQIPLFAWASDRNVAKGRKYVVRTYTTGEEEGQFIASLAKNAGYTRLEPAASIP